ncbi:MAG TPA: hypothetical protein VM694_24150, partial [Polyangium sp.]|nr:hypothetical protein [Polyangium sp.]
MVRRASHDPRGVAAAGATRLALSRGLGLSGSSSPCDDVAYEPETSPFLEPYLPHFEEVRHVLDQFDDFALMPVEVPSRDIGRALAEHLGREGLQVHLFEISDWKELTARLLALPPRSVDPRPVLLLGPRERPKDLERALNFLNLKRDTLARLLGRPLLWCGLKFFLEATWDYAPDVWSIRDITIKIPLLAVSHTEYFVHLDPFVRPVRPPREIKKRIDAQRGSSDEPNLARDLLDYAHALIVRGRAKDAGAPLNRAEAILRKSARAQTTIEEAFLRELRGDHAAVVQGESSAEG